MKTVPFIFFLLTLFFAGCSLPGAVTPAEETTAVEKTVLAMVETMESVQPITPTAALPSSTPAFTKTPEPTYTSTATIGPSPTPTLDPDHFHGSLWYEPEFVSQEGLRYNGRLINTGCTAASVQMVLDFWHDYKEEYQTISAQSLIDQNGWQGQFNPSSGLNIMNTEDDLRELGYYLGTRQDSNKEELITALERYGPLLVLTKVNWTPFGANHMAVVTGYDPEDDLIRVLDPWQIGGIMEFPFENFDGIWSLNYLDDETDTLRRTFFFIVPYVELRESNEPFIPDRTLKMIHDSLVTDGK